MVIIHIDTWRVVWGTLCLRRLYIQIHSSHVLCVYCTPIYCSIGVHILLHNFTQALHNYEIFYMDKSSIMINLKIDESKNLKRRILKRQKKDCSFITQSTHFVFFLRPHLYSPTSTFYPLFIGFSSYPLNPHPHLNPLPPASIAPTYTMITIKQYNMKTTLNFYEIIT